jgi:prepilin-type N-terminal cleavage/methylation domain-containing protein
MKRNLKKGFTLIELVVVIAILGILAGIAIPRFLDAAATARGAKIVADLRTLDSVMTLYYTKTGSYPFIIPGGDSSIITTDNPSEKKYKLLASFPVPPTGTVIFPCDPSKKVTINKPAVYMCSGFDGRAHLYTRQAQYIVDQLVEGGTGF